eukprot:146722-Amphidinium_carterae.1
MLGQCAERGVAKVTVRHGGGHDKVVCRTISVKGCGHALPRAPSDDPTAFTTCGFSSSQIDVSMLLKQQHRCMELFHTTWCASLKLQSNIVLPTILDRQAARAHLNTSRDSGHTIDLTYTHTVSWG